MKKGLAVAVVRLINAVIIGSLYIVFSPFMLLWLMFRRTTPHEYARKKETTEEPPFTLESAARVELFRKCVGKSVAALPVRRVRSKVGSGELVRPATQAEDSVLSGQLRQAQRAERTDASLRRVRSNGICNRKTERTSSIS